MNMSDGRRGRLRHADTVDGDVMGSMGMGGKAIVSVNGCVLCADFGTQHQPDIYGNGGRLNRVWFTLVI